MNVTQVMSVADIYLYFVLVWIGPFCIWLSLYLCSISHWLAAAPMLQGMWQGALCSSFPSAKLSFAATTAAVLLLLCCYYCPCSRSLWPLLNKRHVANGNTWSLSSENMEKCLLYWGLVTERYEIYVFWIYVSIWSILANANQILHACYNSFSKDTCLYKRPSS